MCIECRLRVPVRVGYVRCTYFVNKPLNNDQYHRAHNSHSTRTQHMHKEKMMARRDVSDPSSSSTFRPHGRPSAPQRPMLAAWRPSPLPLAESPLPRQRPPWRLQCARAARRLASRCPTGRPGRHRIRRSSPPPCAASSSFRPRRHRRGTPRAYIFHGGSGCDSDCGSGGGLVMATAQNRWQKQCHGPSHRHKRRVDVEVGV